MDARINIKIFLKTVILFPLFMIFIMFPLCLLIVITAFVPKGRVLATKLYEFFGWIGIVLVGVELNVIGESSAGKPFYREIKSSEAVRIFTGSILPKPINTIAMQENCVVKDDIVYIPPNHKNLMLKTAKYCY